ECGRAAIRPEARSVPAEAEPAENAVGGCVAGVDARGADPDFPDIENDATLVAVVRPGVVEIGPVGESVELEQLGRQPPDASGEPVAVVPHVVDFLVIPGEVEKKVRLVAEQSVPAGVEVPEGQRDAVPVIAVDVAPAGMEVLQEPDGASGEP